MTDTRPYEVLLIGGSPAASSRSSRVLTQLAARLAQHDVRARQFGVDDFPAAELLHGRVEHPQLADFLEATRNAKAVVFATPVYKAVYAGALKLIIDLIQPDGLAGKTVLAVATGKLPAHGPTLDRAFTGLYEFFRGSQPLPTLFLLDNQVLIEGEALKFAPEVQAQVELAVTALVTAARSGAGHAAT
jgi:FMN reductase